MSTKLLLIIIFIIASVGVYMGFGNKFFQNSPKYTGPVEKIRMGTSSLGFETSGLNWIAEDQGYFTQQGLDVVITSPPSTLESQKALSEGKLDFVVASEFSFITNILGEDPMKAKVIATIDKGNWIEVIGRKDKGIGKPADLKGKKIAVFKKTANEFFLGTFLSYNNVSLEDVQLVDLPPDKAIGAIMSGAVDATVITDPFASQLEKDLAENTVNLYSPQDYGVNNYLVFGSDEFIKNHPNAVERYLQALLLAEDFVQKNPNESQEILAKKYNQERSQVSSNWGKHKYSVSLDQSLLLAMENQSRWRIANKLTDKTIVPNFTDFIYTDGLRKVKLEAVTLY